MILLWKFFVHVEVRLIVNMFSLETLLKFQDL